MYIYVAITVTEKPLQGSVNKVKSNQIILDRIVAGVRKPSSGSSILEASRNLWTEFVVAFGSLSWRLCCSAEARILVIIEITRF